MRFKYKVVVLAILSMFSPSVLPQTKKYVEICRSSATITDMVHRAKELGVEKQQVLDAINVQRRDTIGKVLYKLNVSLTERLYSGESRESAIKWYYEDCLRMLTKP